MTVTQAIKKYNLKKETADFEGQPFPDGLIMYTGKAENERAYYFYTLTKDESFSGEWFLIANTVYKGKNDDRVRIYSVTEDLA